MATAGLNHEVEEVVRNADEARSAILQEDWAVAERSLTEAQDRIGRLLREVGDKSRQAMLAPEPDQGDRGWASHSPGRKPASFFQHRAPQSRSQPAICCAGHVAFLHQGGQSWVAAGGYVGDGPCCKRSQKRKVVLGHSLPARFLALAL